MSFAKATIEPRREVQLSLPGVATATSLTLPEDLEYEEWETLKWDLQQVYGAIQWWLGDWLRYGERNFSETYPQAVEQLDYERNTIWNISYVSGAIESSLRSEDLSWSHHKEVGNPMF